MAFSEVIFDATGKRVLAFDLQNESDRRVVKQISAACEETMKRLNAPDSVIQNVGRINEVSKPQQQFPHILFRAEKSDEQSAR